MIRKIIVGTGVLTALGVAAALAQDAGLTPNFGETTLAYGFQPDPFTVEVVAGGPIDVATTLPGEGCSGFISDAPDFQVEYQGPGTQPLSFYVLSAADTTLVINGADGDWYCDDDGLGEAIPLSHDPIVTLDNAPPGVYDIWVGTYASGESPAATLGVTEIARSQIPGIVGLTPAAADPGAGAPLDMTLPPTFGEVTLAVGFEIDPFSVEVNAGGTTDAATISELAATGCVGFVATAPDYRLHYTAGAGVPLHIGVEAAGDTTLIVNDPDGNWFCADDTYGLNPGLDWVTPLSGQYDIWVGTYTAGAPMAATIRITEIPAP